MDLSHKKEYFTLGLELFPEKSYKKTQQRKKQPFLWINQNI